MDKQTIEEWLTYDRQSGKFYWKKLNIPRGKAVLGGEAGGYNHRGYRMITLAGRRYFTHILVWVMETGQLPKNEIDHINRIRDDNRFENLRDVSHLENCWNLSTPINNTSGFMGVSYDKNRGKWVARAKINGKVKQRYCDSIDEARSHRAAFEALRN